MEDFGKIFYKSDRVYNFGAEVRNLASEYALANYENKVFLSNYNTKSVLGNEEKDYSIHQEKLNKLNDEEKEAYGLFFYELESEYIPKFQKELSDLHRNMKDKKNIEAIKVSVMLPLEITKLNNAYAYEKLALELINNLKPKGYTLPYVAVVCKKGNGVYLNIVTLINNIIKKDLHTKF